MPLNESTRKTRERWPLAFDLEGVPRSTAIRSRLIEEQQQPIETEESMNSANVPLVQNNFAVDYQAGNNVIDINNPPTKRYQHQEFPKLVYHHESGHVLRIEDGPDAAKQLKLAEKKGYVTKPAPDRDYSKMSRANIAPVKIAVEAPPLTDEQLLAASDEDEDEK
jgi:hypothetical protein